MVKKRMKAGMLGSVAILLLLAGCTSGGKEEGGSKDSGDTGKITLTMARDSFTDVHPPSKDLWMWKKYEEKTGIHIEWDEIPGESSAERKNVMLASGKLPDAFYQLGFSNSELVKYGEQGLFIPLEDLIEQNAPNMKKWLDDYPEIKKAITMPDGHIYSLPYIDKELPYRSIRLYINKTWLDNLGLQVPQTTDELADVLKAFKEKDANGNGDPNDEMGWVMPSNFINSMFERQLFGSFGMGNGGYKGAGNWIYKDKDGELKLIFNDPKYKEVWQYLNRLFKDGTVPQLNYSGYEYAQWAADGASDKVGAFSWADPNYIGTMGAKNYVGINVLAGPHGDKVMNWMDPMTRQTASLVITKSNKHPEETMKWVDYFYGEEGSKFGFLGTEGETYKMVDGKPQYIDEIKNYKGGVQLGAFQYVDNVYGGGYPYAEPDAELRSAVKGKTVDEDFKTDASELKNYIPEEVWPDFVPTAEEAKKQTAVLTDINKYIQQMRVKFVTGQANFDSDWDEYTATLDKMGAQDYLKIKKAQYDRYQSVK